MVVGRMNGPEDKVGQPQPIAILKDITSEGFYDKVKDNWAIPAGMNADRINASPESQISFLYRKTFDALNGDDEEAKMEAGRMLNYLAQAVREDSFVENAAIPQVAQNLRGDVLSLWEADGVSANEAYVKTYLKPQEKASEPKPKVEGSYELKHEELIEKFQEQLPGVQERVRETREVFKAIKQSVRDTKDVCLESATSLTRAAEAAKTLSSSPEAASRVESMELCAKMFSRLPDHQSAASLLAEAESGLTLPQIKVLDAQHLDSLDGAQAKEYIDGLMTDNQFAENDYKHKAEVQAQSLRKFLGRLGPIVRGLYDGVKNSTDPSMKSIYTGVMTEVEGKMAQRLNLQRIDANPGSVVDFDVMEPLGGEDGRADQKDQIAEEVAPGYTFNDPKFFNADIYPKGAPVIPAQVIVYK